RTVTETDDEEENDDEDEVNGASEGADVEEETISPSTRRSSRNKYQTARTPLKSGRDRRSERTATRAKRTILVDEESEVNDDGLDEDRSRYGSPPSKRRKTANNTHQESGRGIRQQQHVTNGNGKGVKRHSSPQSDGASRASGRSSESGSGSSQSRRRAVTAAAARMSTGKVSDSGRVTRTKGRSHNKVDYREDPSDDDEFLDDELDDEEPEETVVTSSKGRLVKLKSDFTRALRDAR
ncbi:hypothetical protein BIW11_09272, partial [Tropilaelaps mercedesae]